MTSRIVRIVHGVVDERAARAVTAELAALLGIADWREVDGGLQSDAAGVEYRYPAATTGFQALVVGVADPAALRPGPVGGIDVQLCALPAEPPLGPGGRRNVGRIDHAVFLYEGRDELDRARDELRTVLGIDDWDDYGTLEKQGIRVVVSWGSGIELLCPTRAGTVFTDMIAARGMQLASMVLGVADLDAAMARSAELGRPLVETVFDPAPPQGLVDRFAVAREAHAGVFAGEKLVLGEFVDRS
jgi:hypothetical protein